MADKNIPLRYRIADFIKDHGGSMLLAGSSLLVIISGVSPEYKVCGSIPTRIPLMIIAAILFIGGGIVQFWNKKSFREMESRNEEKIREMELERDELIEINKQYKEANEQYYDDVNHFLSDVTAHLASDCELVGEDQGFLSDARLTIYCHHKTKSNFWPLIRIAGNPKYKDFRHLDYPDNVGAISQCWQKGDYALQTNAEGEQWVKEMIEGHYIPDKGIASEIRMQAKSLVAIRLSKENEYLGVLVIESTKKTKTKFKYLSLIQESTWFPILINLILVLRDSHIKISEESSE